MKRKLMMVVLAAAMVGGGSGAVLAGHGPGGGFGGPASGMAMGPGNFVERMAKVLKLTDAQQGQIKTILDAEREQIKPLLDKLHDNRTLLMQAGEATTFDEASVRSLALAQSQVETELTVSRIKTQTQINALLTAEQRELLKNLRPDRERRPSPEAGRTGQ